MTTSVRMNERAESLRLEGARSSAADVTYLTQSRTTRLAGAATSSQRKPTVDLSSASAPHLIRVDSMPGQWMTALTFPHPRHSSSSERLLIANAMQC